MTESNTEDRTANENAPPLPTAQDAGKTVLRPEMQSRPPDVPPPLTSSTGTGFNAPDAGTTLPSGDTADTAGRPRQMVPTPPAEDMLLPQPGNIDRDALVGEEEGAGSQSEAESISSTGPVSG